MGERFKGLVAATATILMVIAPLTSNAATRRSTTSKNSAIKTTPIAAPAEPVACEQTLSLATNTVLPGLSAGLEQIPFDALIDPNPKKNLAVIHPSIVMDINQVAYHAILKHPSRRIKDPTYPIVEHNYYPVYSAGVEEAGGALIIGQYEAIEKFVSYVQLRAGGQASDLALMYTGPAGTGKTEFLTVTDRVMATNAAHNKDSFQYTFEFFDLEKIPALKPIYNEETGKYLVHIPPDSPLTLLNLAPGLRDRVVAMAASRVEGLIGYAPSPWTTMHPLVEQIVTELLGHYFKNKTQITELDYVEMLKKHVRIVRNYIDPRRPPITVDYQGKHPDPGTLYGNENPLLSFVFGKSNPLSYDYDGKVMQLHGRLGAFDEFFRNEEEVQNFSLKIIQSGIVEVNGAPPVRLNTLPIAVSNDESVASAREDGDVKALLNRLMKEPMRQPIHPVLASETALYMAADRKMGGTFKMRKLGDREAQLEPAKLLELYPEPTEDGTLTGPEGRWAVYYTPKPGVEILIAPRALEMLGLTVAGTRLETDVKKLQAFGNVFQDLTMNMNVYEDVTQRLRTIRREIQQQAAVLRDLRQVMFKLHEGEKGITARDAKRWFMDALTYAQKHGHSAVTPVTIDRMLAETITKGSFDGLTNDIAARWMLIHSKIKTDFVMPALTQDIQAIVGGDDGLVDKLYREIVEEILVRAKNPNGVEWEDESGERREIDNGRLDDIARIYENINKQPFNLGQIQSYMLNRRSKEDQYSPLRVAVENFLLQKELSTSAMGELLDYFQGKSVSEETRVRGAQAEASMARFGYNRQAFKEALAFVKNQQGELRRRQRQPR